MNPIAPGKPIWENVAPSKRGGYLRVFLMSLAGGWDTYIAPLCAVCHRNRACYSADCQWRGQWVKIPICKGCEELCFWMEEEIEKILANRTPEELQLRLPLGA
jgi:hypothetical protein